MSFINIRLSAERAFMEAHPELNEFCPSSFTVWLEQQKKAGKFWGCSLTGGA